MKMDNKNKEEEIKSKSYVDILKEASREMPNLVLPSMGIIHNEQKVDINGKDYFIKKNNQ